MKKEPAAGLFAWLKKNVSILLTTITTILVAYITIYVSHQEKEEDSKMQSYLSIKKQRHDDSLSTLDYNYKKAQLLQEFMPSLISEDAKTVRIAFLGFYTIDSNFAIKTALAINTQGARDALSTISFNKSKTINNKIDAGKNDGDTPPGSIALKNAVTELDSAKTQGTSTQHQVGKYLRMVGNPSAAEWSVAFVIWCFEHEQHKKLGIKTTDIKVFYNQLKQRNFIIPPLAKVMAGDIVFFNFQENNGAEQLGIVSNTNNEYIYTIEADNNGEAVSSHIRFKADAMAFARVK